jgi:hypothetical protein
VSGFLSDAVVSVYYQQLNRIGPQTNSSDNFFVVFFFSSALQFCSETFFHPPAISNPSMTMTTTTMATRVWSHGITKTQPEKSILKENQLHSGDIFHFAGFIVGVVKPSSRSVAVVPFLGPTSRVVDAMAQP